MVHAKRVAAVCLIAIATCLVAGAASAAAAPSAVQAYAYSHSFATDGQMVRPFFPAHRSNALGIDPESGDVIVAEDGFLAVFAPDAAPADPPIATFGAEGSWEALAVAPNGDVYVRGGNVLAKYSRNPGSPPSYTRDSTFTPPADVSLAGAGLAVDPGTEELLVAGEHRDIVRYDTFGNRVSTFLLDPHETTFPGPVAATADGTIFVYDSRGEFVNSISRYTPSGQLLERRILSEKAFDADVASMAYDPLHDGVDVVLPPARPGGPARVEGLDASGKRLFLLDFPEATAGETVEGIALDPDRGRLYSVTQAAIEGPAGIHVFEPAIYPGVEAPVVSAITPGSVHLSAEVAPGAGPPSGSYARFEYSADGGQSWVTLDDQDDTSASTIEADLAGLEPNFPYLVRALAGNDEATHVTGATAFTTTAIAPVVATIPPTDVTETSAVLNGTINPAALQTTYHFEYGPTSSYGSRIPAGIEAVAGNGRAPRIFSRTLSGLLPDTTYHYRLVATNAIGEGQGEDRTFTTAAPGSIPSRAYEQVTPVDKKGGSIFAPSGFQVSADGSQLAYMLTSPGEGRGSPLFARSFSRRGDTDWESGIPIDPPLNSVRTTVFFTTLGISSDFSHAFVVSDRALAPGAIENGTNLYVEDLAQGAYSLVASTNVFGAIDTFVGIQQGDKFIAGTSDYSTVIFGSAAPLLGEVHGTALYRWTRSGGLTLESTLPGGGVPEAEVQLPQHLGSMRTVSADARRDYFTLRAGSDAGVYLKEDGQTRAISVSHRGGDPATVQPGELLGVSRDGRYAFFVSFAGQLTDDAPEQANNVYRYDAVTHELRYTGAWASKPDGLSSIGTSDSGDTLYLVGGEGESAETSLEVWRDGTLSQIAIPGSWELSKGFVSPDGRYLAVREWNDPNASIYLYDAETHSFACASCRADGTDPGGARLPDPERYASGELPTPLDERGDLFFSATARLVAADTNGTGDVYEFSHGRLHLVTPGDQPFDAFFADVSPSGRDVYLTTAQPLVSRDTDQAYDVYDARIGGGLAAQNPPDPQICIRDDCKATPNGAAEPRIGGSELLSGPGNVKAKKGRVCPKRKRAVKRKGKAICVKRHTRMRHHRKAHRKKAHPKQANHHRRQGR